MLTSSLRKLAVSLADTIRHAVPGARTSRSALAGPPDVFAYVRVSFHGTAAGFAWCRR